MRRLAGLFIAFSSLFLGAAHADCYVSRTPVYTWVLVQYWVPGHYEWTTVCTYERGAAGTVYPVYRTVSVWISGHYETQWVYRSM